MVFSIDKQAQFSLLMVVVFLLCTSFHMVGSGAASTQQSVMFAVLGLGCFFMTALVLRFSYSLMTERGYTDFADKWLCGHKRHCKTNSDYLKVLMVRLVFVFILARVFSSMAQYFFFDAVSFNAINGVSCILCSSAVLTLPAAPNSVDG